MGSTNDFTITEAEANAFMNMSRDEVLALSPIDKQKYLFSFQVKHSRLEEVAKSLKELSNSFNETKIVFVIGATGVGKTTLAKRLISQIKYDSNSTKKYNGSSIPYIYIRILSNGHKAVSWVSIFKSILAQDKKSIKKKKVKTVNKDGTVSVRPVSESNLNDLREALDSMLRYRKVKFLVIDEAYHLLRFGNLEAIMDTLKSIVDEIPGLKLILLGSYDIADLAVSYGQVCRRGDILHFKRYKVDDDDDIIEFGEIIYKIQMNWPCEFIPNFRAISKELMEASLGCVGLLKTLLLRALDMQLKNKGNWDINYLTRAVKSTVLLNTINSEIAAGEIKLEGITYGESVFQGKYLEELKVKMESTQLYLSN